MKSDCLCRVVVRVFCQSADSGPCVSPLPVASLVEDGDTMTALVSPLTTDTQTAPVLSLVCVNSLNTAQVCVCVCVLGFVKAFFCNVQMYACIIVCFLSLFDSCELI